MQKNRFYILSLSILIWIFNAGCVQYIARYDGPYEGKIIDAETNQPIEGVVVLGVGTRSAYRGRRCRSYYDAKETITDW
jgi:hypothetical protein